MRALATRSLLVALVLALPGLALAQGLGDAAAREKQKRQATPNKTKRVITNDDLRKDEPDKKAEGQGASPAQESGSSSASPSNSQAERESRSHTASESDSRQQAIDQAQAQVESARSAVVAAEARVKELGDKLNPMSPSFIYGQAQSGDAAGEEMRTREALRAADAELAGAREGLVQANKNLEDVRQGRRTSSDR
jgi:vacuolar-type H+-ATPase subunit I/STV1